MNPHLSIRDMIFLTIIRLLKYLAAWMNLTNFCQKRKNVICILSWILSSTIVLTSMNGFKKPLQILMVNMVITSTSAKAKMVILQAITALILAAAHGKKLMAQKIFITFICSQKNSRIWIGKMKLSAIRSMKWSTGGLIKALPDFVLMLSSTLKKSYRFHRMNRTA